MSKRMYWSVLTTGAVMVLTLSVGANPKKSPWQKQHKQQVKQPAPNSVGAQPSRTRTNKPPAGVASPNAVRAREASALVFGAPVHYQNLSLVPVGTTNKGPFQNYTLLEEGVRDKTLEVRELKGRSGQAQVSAVEVRNRGNYPVYLLGGEMILGGKQDRIIQQDTVVSNKGRWTKVSVFCVEQGRWRGQNMKFGAGKAIAHLKLQKAIMSDSQSKVWSEVAKKNVQHGTQSSTSTYRRTIQNNKVRSKIAPYRKKLMSKLPANTQLAGVVFAINGKIQVADLFGNPLLFGKLRDKLMSAYILEALGKKVVANAAPVSVDSARMFLKKGRSAKSQRIHGKSTGRAINYRKKAKGVIGMEAVDPSSGKKLRESYHAN